MRFLIDVWNWFGIFRYPLGLFLIFYILFTLSTTYWKLYYNKRGIKAKKRTYKTKYKPREWYKKLFIDFPKQFAKDMLDRDPEAFRESGLIVFTGFQGSGKTSSMTQYALELQERYPRAKLISNYAIKTENDELDDWRKLTEYNNKQFGVICCIDELQNWFNSKSSKNFPPQMLAVVTQNRKNRRVILATAQNFYMLAKDIRSQCSEIRKCMTIAGCITIVHRVRPIVNNSGEIEETKNLGFYFYVHNEKLRDAYDTYKVIENLSKADFKEKIQLSDISEQ